MPWSATWNVRESRASASSSYEVWLLSGLSETGEFAVILIVLHTISSRFMLPDMRGAGAVHHTWKIRKQPETETVPG